MRNKMDVHAYNHFLARLLIWFGLGAIPMNAYLLWSQGKHSFLEAILIGVVIYAPMAAMALLGVLFGAKLNGMSKENP